VWHRISRWGTRTLWLWCMGLAAPRHVGSQFLDQGSSLCLLHCKWILNPGTTREISVSLFQRESNSGSEALGNWSRSYRSESLNQDLELGLADSAENKSIIPSSCYLNKRRLAASVLAVACRIFHCGVGASLWLWPSGPMARGICIWDLHPLTKNQTRVPCVGGRLSTTGPPERSLA